MSRKAFSLNTLLKQINDLSPNRDRTSDGWIGDDRHKKNKSDHNANAAGVVCALDIDDDPSHGVDNVALGNALLESGDPRLAYVIMDGMIISGPAGTKPGQRRKHKGKNPHKMHLHISVSQKEKLYDDGRKWDLSRLVVKPGQATKPVAKVKPVLAKGPNNDAREVENLQRRLNELGAKPTILVDGFFGPATEKAVIAFQRKHKIVDDGVVGKHTRELLVI